MIIQRSNLVQQLLDHRMENDGLKIKVQWLVFNATHDSWEPLPTLLTQDVSGLVKEYSHSKRTDCGCDRALWRYFLG